MDRESGLLFFVETTIYFGGKTVDLTRWIFVAIIIVKKQTKQVILHEIRNFFEKFSAMFFAKNIDKPGFHCYSGHVSRKVE